MLFFGSRFGGPFAFVVEEFLGGLALARAVFDEEAEAGVTGGFEVVDAYGQDVLLQANSCSTMSSERFLA